MAKESDSVRARALASQDLEDIESLKSNPAFQRYFERRILGQLAALRETVLHDIKLDRDTLWEARLKYLATLEVSIILLQDESACKRMLVESREQD